MEPQDDTSALKKLEEKLQRFQDAKKPVGPDESAQAGMGKGMQVGIELVAGVLVGVGIGLVLDRWFGTSPLMLILCFFMGTAGGALNLYRTVQTATQDVNEDSKGTKP